MTLYVEARIKAHEDDAQSRVWAKFLLDDGDVGNDRKGAANLGLLAMTLDQWCILRHYLLATPAVAPGIPGGRHDRPGALVIEERPDGAAPAAAPVTARPLDADSAVTSPSSRPTSSTIMWDEEPQL